MVLSKDDQDESLFSKSLRVWTKGINPEASQIAHHIGQKLGPPIDVRIHATPDGYLLTWNPPEFGLEDLRIYIIKWFQGPHQHLVGSAETKNTSYLSKLPILSFSKIVLLFVVNDLEEGFDYQFQLVAMSYQDYQVESEKLPFQVPPYRRIRSVSIGLITGIAFVALIILAVYFVKKKLCNTYSENNRKHSTQ